MNAAASCPECQAAWVDGNACQAAFYQMLAWESEYAIYDVHHLLVLCYYLQHPSLYSPEALLGAQKLLVDFLIKGISPQQVRQRDRVEVDSGRRKFKIKGKPDSHGAYANPVAWSMTAVDVVARGVEVYQDNVKAWARAVYRDIQLSGNQLSG
jgi:hypothetical protein